jgi:uridylate kinase
MVIPMMNDAVVISMGGSVMIPEDPSPDFIRRFADILTTSERKVYVVIGGGKLARNYIAIARELGCDEGFLDEIGIDATRLNARLLIAALGHDAYPLPAKTFDEAVIRGREFGIVVMGGTHPGHTTDGVAAMLAERLGAERLIIATNVTGVYTEDPRKNPEARKFRKMSSRRLLEIASAMEGGAGKSAVLDPLAARLVDRTGIPTLVCDGRELDIVRKGIEAPIEEIEDGFPGTLITKDGQIVMEDQ